MKIEELVKRMAKFPGSNIELSGERDYIISHKGDSLISRNIYNMWIWLKEQDQKEYVEEISIVNESENELSDMTFAFRRSIGKKAKITRTLFNEHISQINGVIIDVKGNVIHMIEKDKGLRFINLNDVISYKL